MADNDLGVPGKLMAYTGFQESRTTDKGLPGVRMIEEDASETRIIGNDVQMHV